MTRSAVKELSIASWTFPVNTERSSLFSFFFNDTATTEIYTLSLHDALPISSLLHCRPPSRILDLGCSSGLLSERLQLMGHQDRKSTRLNSSHSSISYAV